MKILLAGNSFCADFTCKFPDQPGWTNWLANQYQVNNQAQAGVSEYKILQQLRKVNLDDYHAVVISHSSATRIYCEQHPIHYNSALHKNADLIYADVKAYSSENKDCALAAGFFERFFDMKYAKEIHQLICKEISNLLLKNTCFHIVEGQHCFDQAYDIAPLIKKYYSDSAPNHLTQEGHKKIYSVITDWINTIS